MTSRNLKLGTKRFNALMDHLRETAKDWGYKSKRDQVTFINGAVYGLAYDYNQVLKQALKRKRAALRAVGGP